MPPLLRLSLFCLFGFVLCMGFIFCGCAKSTLGKTLNVGVGAAAAADLVTTSQAEDRGGREWNRLLGDSELQRWVVRSLGVAGVIGIASLLEIKGKPVLSHLVRGVAISVSTWAALHNARWSR